jgi:hypothetical protein
MNKNINVSEIDTIKIDIVKKAILMGWAVTVPENNTIVITKKKFKMNNLETNTELLLSLLVSNNDYDTSIRKKCSIKVN